MNDVAVIIVSYNCREALRQCLRSLPAVRTVVIDNASADDTVAMLADFPAITTIANRTNLGFAAACNQGITATTEPFILLLNPDTDHPPIAELAACLTAHPEVGACGPRILNPGGTPQVSCRRFPTLPRMALAELGLRQFYYVTTPDLDVDQLMGSCLMLRRAALDKVGLLDERFFVYFEEVDLCLRLHRGGWRVCYLHGATVNHTGGQSSRTDRAASLRYRYRSLFEFYRKHYPAWHRYVLKCVVQVAALLRGGDYAGIAREVWRL